MANKRMFSNSVIDSDSFGDLSIEAQALYFHIGMKTDDDGMVSGAKRIARTICNSDKPLQELNDAGFVFYFPQQKVCVVKHHRVNNNVQNDRYHETVYQDVKRQLVITANKEYNLRTDEGVSESDTSCIQSVSNVYPEHNLTQPNKTQPNPTERSPTEPIVSVCNRFTKMIYGSSQEDEIEGILQCLKKAKVDVNVAEKEQLCEMLFKKKASVAAVKEIIEQYKRIPASKLHDAVFTALRTR